jgi:hypothetical protein
LRTRSTTILASVSAVSLSLFYLSALTRGAINGTVFPATFTEQTILGTMLARLVVILAIPRLRHSSSGALNILSVEVLLLPILVLGSYLTGDPFYLDLIRGIFFAWPAAFMVVSPLYTIPKLTWRIADGGSLSTVIPTMTSLFALLTFLDVGLGNVASGVGLSNVTKFALLSAAGAAPPLAINAEMIALGVVAYAAMIFYSLRRDSGPPVTDSVLALASVGTLGALAWGVVASYFISSAQLVFGAPALILVGLTWLMSRGH